MPHIVWQAFHNWNHSLSPAPFGLHHCPYSILCDLLEGALLFFFGLIRHCTVFFKLGCCVGVEQLETDCVCSIKKQQIVEQSPPLLESLLCSALLTVLNAGIIPFYCASNHIKDSKNMTIPCLQPSPSQTSRDDWTIEGRGDGRESTLSPQVYGISGVGPSSQSCSWDTIIPHTPSCRQYITETDCQRADQVGRA